MDHINVVWKSRGESDHVYVVRVTVKGEGEGEGGEFLETVQVN